MPKWKIKAEAFAQQLADLLGYEVWVVMDFDDIWYLYQVPPYIGMGRDYWTERRYLTIPSQGRPRNWKNTLVHAKPGETT